MWGILSSGFTLFSRGRRKIAKFPSVGAKLIYTDDEILCCASGWAFTASLSRFQTNYSTENPQNTSVLWVNNWCIYYSNHNVRLEHQIWPWWAACSNLFLFFCFLKGNKPIHTRKFIPCITLPVVHNRAVADLAARQSDDKDWLELFADHRFIFCSWRLSAISLLSNTSYIYLYWTLSKLTRRGR